MRLRRHDAVWLLAVVSLMLSGASRSGPPAPSAEQAGTGTTTPAPAPAADPAPRDRAPVGPGEVRAVEPTPAPAPPTPRAISEPVALRIPAIGVDAPLTTLGTTEGGELEVPGTPEEAGWWADGVRPGGHGPAVVAGHVDWTDGPAVFHRLRELRPGDAVEVEGHDGHRLTFTVTEVVQVSKDGFPTAEVYGPTEAPTLRLITCGGAFDEQARSYLDNVVVTAEWQPSPR